MITRIRKILVLFLVVAISAAIIVQNLDPVEIQITPNWKFSAIEGIVLLVVFALGILLAALFWLAFGIKAYFREKSLHNKERKREEFYRDFLAARAHQATHEWGKAEEIWSQLCKKDPSNVVARVELARSLEQKGDSRGALRVIDEARAESRSNVEVLFEAARLNSALGNKTAAIDNLALILYHHPNKRAAAMARDLSEELGRIEDAMEYHREYEKLGGRDKEADETLTRLEFRKLTRDADGSEPYLAEVRKFKRKHPDFVPALQALAELEHEAGNIHEAAQLFVDAARLTGERKYWHEASRLWIENGLGDRALSAANAAIRNSRGRARLNAELDLIRLLLGLGRYEDARAGIENFPSLLKEQHEELDAELVERLIVLRGYCLNKLERYQEAGTVWEQLTDSNFQLPQTVQTDGYSAASVPPAPRLSTP